jgi:hypothetical protein
MKFVIDDAEKNLLSAEEIEYEEKKLNEQVGELLEKYPELKNITRLSDKYGEPNEITILVEAIIKLYIRFESILNGR